MSDKLRKHQSKLLLALILLATFLAHFHEFDFAQRHMIRYDDHRFIEPMLKLSLHDYFTTWFPDRANFAYPVRDMTFFFDQWLSQRIGFQTTWISHFFIFALTLVILNEILKLFLPANVYLRASILALTALHPLNVEPLQWASIRKTLLVGLFTSAASYLVLRAVTKARALTNGEWFVVFILWCLSMFSWPTAIIWLFWALFVQREYLLTNRRRGIVLTVLAFIASAAFWVWSTSGTTDHSKGAADLLALDLNKTVYWSVRSFGRAFFNLVLPVRLAPYYEEESWLNFIGFFALLIFSVIVTVRVMRAYRRSKTPSSPQSPATKGAKKKKQAPAPLTSLPFASLVNLLSLSFVLFIPSCLIFLTYDEFVWADRYMYLVIPYILLTLALLFNVPQRHLELSPVQKRAALGVLFCYLGLFTLITWQRVPLWRSDLTLMKQCTETEGSPKCLIQTIQKTYNHGGCLEAYPFIEQASARRVNSQPKRSVEFNIEVPFYHGMCVATVVNVPPEEKIKELGALMDKYKGSPELIPSLIFVNLESGKYQQALDNARQYFLSGRKEPLQLTKNLVNVYRGQAKALCDFFNAAPCKQAQAAFEEAHKGIEKDQSEIDWGYSATMNAIQMSIKK